MRTLTSELLQIPGIGPAKRRLLLQQFGSVQGVREAGEAAIAALPGFGAATARRVLHALAPELADVAPTPAAPDGPTDAAAQPPPPAAAP
jgi:excinuclease ABC subunit C